MKSTTTQNHLCYGFACMMWVCHFAGSVSAQDNQEVPEWTADEAIVARLGEVFTDSRISIRPPGNLQKVDRPDSPELTAKGVYNYGWASQGIVPSGANLSIGLTPYSRPSSAALDKMVAGMQKSIEESFQDASFKAVQKGRFRGIEVRSGEFSGRISGRQLTAYYLIGIDDTGSFGVTAMVPTSELTAEKSTELKSAILTFERAKK